MAASSIPQATPRPRVLIAEDQPDIIEAIRMVLKQEGFEAHAVDSPNAAIAALAAQPFDLLLMDLNYTRDTTSGVEGLDLLKRVQQAHRNLPVIVMTAWGSVELAVEAMRRGAADFIQKPWDNWRLVGMVRNQMERRQELRKAESMEEMEMREAGEIQRRLLPRHITQIPGIDIAVDWKPARILGGDYFDVLRFAEGTVGLCIADVEGKGVPAALVMSNLQSAVKAFASPALQPKDLCQRLNSIFCDDVQADRSISLFYAHLDPVTGRVVYANAGHCPPLLIRAHGTDERLDSGGAVLGRLPHWKYEQKEVTLRPGDRMVLFTDGVTEVENSAEEEFGEKRVAALARSCKASSAAEMQQHLLERAAEHGGNKFRDDATLMVVAVG